MAIKTQYLYSTSRHTCIAVSSCQCSRPARQSKLHEHTKARLPVCFPSASKRAHYFYLWKQRSGLTQATLCSFAYDALRERKKQSVFVLLLSIRAADELFYIHFFKRKISHGRRQCLTQYVVVLWMWCSMDYRSMSFHHGTQRKTAPKRSPKGSNSQNAPFTVMLL